MALTFSASRNRVATSSSDGKTEKSSGRVHEHADQQDQQRAGDVDGDQQVEQRSPAAARPASRRCRRRRRGRRAGPIAAGFHGTSRGSRSGAVRGAAGGAVLATVPIGRARPRPEDCGRRAGAAGTSGRSPAARAAVHAGGRPAARAGHHEREHLGDGVVQLGGDLLADARRRCTAPGPAGRPRPSARRASRPRSRIRAAIDAGALGDHPRRARARARSAARPRRGSG